MSAPESGRYYAADGTFVPGADARQAKRDGLLPSVTTLLRELATPHGLVQWRERQVALTAARYAIEDELPMYLDGGEPYLPETCESPAWLDARREEAWADSRRKRDAGTDLHGVIANYLAGRWAITRDDLPFELAEMLDHLAIRPAADGKIERQYISREWGFAGTADYIGPVEGAPAVLDFKSTSVAPDRDTPYWAREWRTQLAGYCIASGLATDRCYNVVICRDTGRAWPKRYTPAQIREGKRVILLAACLWYANRQTPDADLPPRVRAVLEAMG